MCEGIANPGKTSDGGLMPPSQYLQYDAIFFFRTGKRGILLEQHQTLDSFLASIQKRAFRMAEIATGNREDAFDILQDAMCKFVEKYAASNFNDWMPLFYTVLQSRIRDWYRRETVRNRFRVWFGSPGGDEETDPMDNLPDERSHNPEQELLNSRSIDVLHRSIRALPIRQQQAFMLRVFEGLDVTQTAKVMKCSTGSVKTHYSRAIHVLREQLRDHWP